MLQEIPAPAPVTEVPAGLSYMTDRRPGFSRRKVGKKFHYFNKSGQRITDESVIARINALGIPPAYKDVWICPTANGHLQATGIDARGRKQYRYHPKWREARDENKFSNILAFGRALPAMRRQIASHMRQQSLTREKVLATVVSLLEKTLIRVGNSEYAKSNDSYGLTTLRRKHVAVDKDTTKFRFKGKSGKEWNLALTDRRIAKVVKECADLPGYELFKYVDKDGIICDVTSNDVNSYLKEIGGAEANFTAKDFRTWAGTVLAAIALKGLEKCDTPTAARRNIKQAVEKVAKQLGNTPAICRKCYIHPHVIDSYMTGDLAELIGQKIDQKFRRDYDSLNDDEVLVLAFLKKRLTA